MGHIFHKVSPNESKQTTASIKKEAVSLSRHRWALGAVCGAAGAILVKDHLTYEPHVYNFMHALPDMVWIALAAVAVVAIVVMIAVRRLYSKTGNPVYRQIKDYAMWYCFIFCAIVMVDRVLLNFASMVNTSIQAPSNPEGFIEAMIYMAYKGRKIWWRGITGTLEISLFGTLIGFVLAVLLVFCRIQTPDARDSENRQLIKIIGSGFAKAYVTIIRGTPMMVQALVIYYAGFNIARAAMPTAPISQVNQVWSFFLSGVITVSLNSTAYLAEVLRSGIESLDKGQTEAARSLGMTPWQTMMEVIFPQAVKNSIPSICNEFIINVKDTSVLNMIGVFELMYATTTVVSTYFKNLPVYCITAIIYLFLTYCLTWLLNLLAKRLDAPTSKGVPSSN